MPPRILIVEDNPTTRKILRVALETEGYCVIEAPDARTALAAVDEAAPDLVLQDLILPDMGGLDLVRRLRASTNGRDLPILALSGFLSRLEESQTATAGFTALLVKPIEPSHLIESIRAYLPQPAPEPSGVVGGGRHLLVVDDDPVQLKLTRVVFSQAGFDVASAGGAADALRAARSRRPDVILSDVFMPEVDGFQLCLAIRQDEQLSTVPVVLLSSRYSSHDDDELARGVGASALVLRTPDFSSARQAVVEALGTSAPIGAEPPNVHLQLKHAQRVIQLMEREQVPLAGLTQRCAMQAAQLSLLSGVAGALTRRADTDAVLRDVLAATLDAAGISKGALMLRTDTGALRVRHHIGFSETERSSLEAFFGQLPLLEEIVLGGASITVPSSSVPAAISQAILADAHATSVHVVPLLSDGHGMGALIIASASGDLSSDDSVAFARAIGTQIVQSLALTRSVDSLSASEQRYRTLLDGASDAIAALTPDGVIRQVNPRWEALAGVPRDQLVGRHIEAILSTMGDPGGCFMDALAASAGRPVPLAITDARGARALLEVSSAKVEVGESLLLTISRDVTEQRRLEDQLRQAHKLEAIGQLAGGVAHDFNNLLTVILGFTASAMDDLGPAHAVIADLIEVHKAGERAAALTRQLLAFSRKQVLAPRVLDINEVVKALEPMLRRLVFEDIKVTVSLAPKVGLVSIDPTQVEQILVNLAVNAADAMPHGGTLTIETADAIIDDLYQRRHLPVTPGPHVMLAVSDTGSGMDETVAAHIFEPFFTTKGVGKGTGLGLSTVYGIVGQSGGDIWVYSEPGHGSSFKIYLPHAHETVGRPAPRSAMATPARGGVETVLLVEDDDAVRRLTRATLARHGYHVIDAANPREARRLAADFTGPIHLLLSDVIMPESDGPPLFDQLEAGRPGLRVVYMSGYAADAVVRHGAAIAGTPFLEKPFTTDALLGKVRAALDAPQGRSAAT